MGSKSKTKQETINSSTIFPKLSNCPKILSTLVSELSLQFQENVEESQTFFRDVLNTVTDAGKLL